MPSGEDRISEKESIMLTKGQNRKTPIDSTVDPTEKRQTSPSGNPPENTSATTGETPGGGGVVEEDEEAR